MPIFTSRALKGTQKPTPDFQKKGINLSSSTLTSAHIIGVPERRQVAFSAYVSFIAAFLKSTELQKKLPTGFPGYPINLPITKAIHIEPPMLGVTIDAKKYGADKIEKLKHDHGMYIVNFMGTSVYVFPKPTSEIAKILSKICEIDTKTPSGISNLLGYSVWNYSLKLITLFASTHTYPAFQTPLADESTVHNYEQDLTFTANLTEPSAKKIRLAIPADDDEDMDEVEVEDLEIPSGHREVSFASVVPMAKPAPFRPEINFGPPSSVPTIGGVLFPYFHGLLVPDYSWISSVVARFFLQTLGANKEDILAGYRNFKRGSNTWVDSYQGQVLQHMFQGIQLALETQSRVYFILETEYAGFVLLGYGFSILAQDRIFNPLDHKELRAELDSLVSHGKTVSALADLLSHMKMISTKKVRKVKPEEITCNRVLHTLYHERDSTGLDADFERLVSDLAFPEPYWNITVDNLGKMFDDYAGVNPYPPTAPMFLGGSFVKKASKEFLALSAFGPSAPSFFTHGGDKFVVPSEMMMSDPLSAEDPVTKRKPLPVIAVSQKSLAAALGDLEKVYKDGAIYQKITERAGPARTIQFRKEYRDQLWAILRKRIGGGHLPQASDPDEEVTAEEKDIGVDKSAAVHDAAIGGFD